jgi:acyl-CoA synthetase (AMP-forming)/AMP-acid ligase II
MLRAGLATKDRDPIDMLVRHRIGMTDLVKRSLARAEELRPEEFRQGVSRLDILCRWLRPGAVCVLGLTGWRWAVDPAATVGVQDRQLGGRPVYLMPNPSGANAHVGLDDLASHLRVALASDNDLDPVVAMYAVPRAGAVLVPLNTRSTAAEMRAVLESTTPAVLLGAPGHLEVLLEELRSLPRVPRVLSICGAHPGAEEDLSAVLDRNETQDHGPATDAAPVAVNTRGCAWIIHTSGTTGPSKGAMLTHASLLAATLNTAVARPLTADDVYLYPFPLFHVAAYNVLHAHLRRRPVVLVPRFDPAEVLRLIAEERVTCCSLAPTMISMLLDHPGYSPADLDGLRQISYGASPMPSTLLRRLLEELPGCGLAQGYGMTELSGNAVFLDPEEHRRAVNGDPALLGAAGRPGPLVAVRIAGDDGEALPSGAEGEILVRGDQVCAGYWNDPAADAESRHGRWLRTGDIGRVDEEGYLHVVDRRKDIIITGGENVSSREVEEVLSTHPCVAQVAVVGAPDERWGEAVTAVVVPSVPGGPDGVGDLLEWSRGRLAGFKRPKRVVTVEALPLNASGKVDKRHLRALFRQEPSGSALSGAPGP